MKSIKVMKGRQTLLKALWRLLPLLTFIFGLATFVRPVSAEARPSTLTINFSSENTVLDITPEENGRFGKSAATSISVSTDNFTGYTLSISAADNGGLTDGKGHTIESISAPVTEQEFTNNSAYNNKWGYRPSQYVTTENDTEVVVPNTSFLPAPTTTATVLDITDEANTESNIYQIDLGARLDYDTVSGSYEYGIVIMAVTNDIVYNITYDENTEDTVGDMPEENPQVVTIEGTSLTSSTTLSDAEPTRTGYVFAGWCDEATTLDAIGNQVCGGTTYAAGAEYGIDQTIDGSNIVLYAIWTFDTYTVTLDQGDATAQGSATTTATYNQNTLAQITLPEREYTISGFTASTNNASGATVNNGITPSSLSSSYTLNGWYKESAAVTLVASADATPVLEANVSGFTDANGNWIATEDKTLYASWTTPAATILPTIVKEGYTCGWTETETGATTIQFESGASIVPAKNYQLYGVCVAIDYTVTLRAGNGIESLALAGWTNTGTSTLTKVYHIGDTIDLSLVTPTYKTGYNGAKYAKNDNIGTLSGATYTVGAGNGDITINASGLNTPVCTIQGGATRVYGYKATTLTATSNAENYDENVIITYSFGYADSATSTLGNFGAAGTANTLSIGKSAFYGARHYGVRVVVTDPNDNTITNTCTSGTGSSTSTTIANRTTMTLVNSRIVFNPNGGTLNGSSALYVHYGGTISQLYTSRTNNTALGALPTVTPPAGHTFSGWYTSGDALVIDENGNLATTAVSGWINGSQKWVKTGTSNSSTGASYQLYAHYTANDYNITLDNNGATTPGSLATNVTYGDTTLGAITTPIREYEVNNFSTSGNNASGATVSSTATLNSEYTFNGWHITSGTGALVASNDTTPALQANVSGYTDADGKWIATEGKTLYAGWTAGASAQVTLPTIEKAGYTCGWTETETGATTIQYNSGASLYPTQSYELYGVCIPIDYTITVKAGNGISALTLSGWTGTGTATLTKTYHIGDTINLSSFTETYKTGYSGEKYIKNSGAGSLSDATYTVGAGAAEITVSATSLGAPVCTISGGGLLVYNYTDSTLTAGSNASYYDTDSVNITYSFGYSATTTGALGYFDTASSTNTRSISKTAYLEDRYYGVTVVVADKNDNTITNTCTSGTGTGTSGRTRMSLVNSRISFDASTYGGTLSGTNPIFVQYNSNTIFKERFSTTTASLPTATPPTGYTFTGWYNSSNAKVINVDGSTVPSVSDWTNSNGRWIRTSGNISSTDPVYYLYAHYSPNSYNIAYDYNHGSAGSSAPAAASYDETVNISNPEKTVSVTGNANGSSCTVGSATSAAQTFAGWTSSTTSGTATTSATESGTFATWNGSATTNAYFKNLKENTGDTVTMVATWTPVAFNLPTVSRTGYTCKWYENDAGTIPSNGYNSGASYTPTADSAAAITMYAKATPKTYTIALNGNNATTAGTTSTTATYDSATLSPSITAPVQNRKLTVSAASDITVTYASGTNCTSASACSANATLNGYYTATSGGTKVINADGTLVANVSGYTGANGIWKKDDGATLNAQWTGNAITLPTATKTGYTCNWTDGTNTFNNGASYIPSANSTTITANCTIKTNLSLKVTFNTTYVSSIKVCKTSGNCSGTNLVATVTTSGTVVPNLTYNTAYYLYPTYTTGSKLSKWAKDSGAVGTLSSTSAANPTYTIGDGTNAVTHTGAYNTYNISYNLNGADTTSNPSTKPTTGTYASAVNISNPTKTVTITGNENNSGCTVGADTSNTRTFAGWTSSTLSSTATTATSASGTYSAWNGTTATKNQYFKNLRSDNNGTVTMVANWSGSLTLPTISREGHDCKWYLNDAGTGTAYNSGSSLSPATEPGTTLNVFAKATPLSYTVTLTAGPGVSALTAAGWTGTGTATISKSFTYGSTIDLSTITPTYKTGYSGTSYTKTDSAASSSLSGSTYTVGAGAGAVTIKATTLATPTCSISSNASSTARVYNYTTTIFTATNNSSNYDSSVNISYSFGYASSDSATLGNFVSAGSSNTITMGATGRLPSTASSGDWRGTRYYGVKVVVTDSTDSSITTTCTSGTGGTTDANTVANRVRMLIRNAYINFDANGGSIDKTRVYTYYKSADVYSGSANSTVTTLPTVTPPAGHAFDGWYTAASGGSKILNADGTLVNQAISGWIVLDGSTYKWGAYTTSSTSRKLYAHYTANNYSIAYTLNGGNNPSSMPTSADYETAVNISNPEKTFTVNINANGQNASIKNASNQDVTSASSAQIFAGWTSTTIGSNAKTGVSSSAITTDWDGTATTNQYFMNLKESGTVTMVANWTPVGVVLPSITKTGYTCGYATSATGNIVYNSGSSYATTATGNSATLFAKCNIDNPAAPTISGGTTKVLNRSDTTLTCSSSTTYASGASKYYEFGYSTTSNGIVTWLGNPSTTNTYSVKNSGDNAANFIGARYYTCRVYASDGTQTSSTATATSKTNMYHVNVRVFFDVATNGGTRSGSTNIYTAYQKADVYSGRMTTDPGTIPTATKDTFNFEGWFTAAEGGSKVIAADGTIQPSVSGWTDANGRWIRNSTADNDTTNVLYAQFDPTTFNEAYAAAGKEKIQVSFFVEEYYTMKDMNPSICAAVSIGEEEWLIDTRVSDNHALLQPTRVVKAEDGRCWMKTELAVDPGDLGEPISISNTNVSSSTAINRFTNGGGTTSDKYPITGVQDWTAASDNSYSQPLYAWGEQSGTYYYNYCAASMGSYCYGDGTSPGTPEGTPTDDICPAGWRLPSGGSNGEVQNLYNIINNQSTFINRLNINLVGWYNKGGGINEQGTLVYFPTSNLNVWSMTENNFNSSNSAGRMVGMPIRCISKDRYEMQNVTASDLNDLAPNNGDVTTLYDKRDDQEYSVSRLADGNVWMLDNLALDIVNTSLNNLQGNTHSTATSIERLKNGGGTTSDRYPVSGVSNWTSSYSYSVPQTNTSRKDTVITDSRYVPVNGQGSNKVGVYYNYCAASAGYYCFGNGIDPGTTASGDSTYDICPTGWRLPTENELSTLYSLYDGSFADFGTALSIAGTGWFINGAAASSANAYFWSKTYASNNSMGKLSYRYGDRTVKVGSTEHRAYGNSVRCVKQTNTMYMQDVDDAILNSLAPNPGDTAVLYDKRDNTPYAVGKLEDGSFWMLDNLALDLTDSSVQSNLANNTNATATSIGYLINGGGSANGKWATNGVAKWGSSNSYSSPLVYDGEKNTTSPDDSSQLYGWRMGIYYNFCAASAGDYCYESGYNSDPPRDSTHDICPSGWQIPSGSQYSNLIGLYDTKQAFRSALHAPLSGYYKASEITDADSRGLFWSSTVGAVNTMQRLNVFSENMSATAEVTAGNRNGGYPIRCVKAGDQSVTGFARAYSQAGKTKKTAADGDSYYSMQDMNSSICNAVSVAMRADGADTQTEKVVDERDGKVYWIAKHKDGKCWMTQNLDLDLETTPTNVAALTHANTDLGWTTGNTSATWTPASGTLSKNANSDSVSGWSNSQTAPRSADMLDTYVYTSGAATSYNPDTNPDIIYTSLGACTAAGRTADECKHYHTGNYYNYSAMVASNNTSSLTTGNAPDSICPAGWRLPHGGATTSTDPPDGEWGILEAAYDIPHGANGYAWWRNTGFVPLRTAPLYLTMFGKIDAGTWNQKGIEAQFPTSQVLHASATVMMSFHDYYGYYDSYYNTDSRAIGRPVRCVAR